MEGLERNTSRKPMKNKVAAAKKAPVQKSTATTPKAVSKPKPAPMHKPEPIPVDVTSVTPVGQQLAEGAEAKARQFSEFETIKIIKTVLQIKFALFTKSSADKVEILRFETDPEVYNNAMVYAKDTLSELSARAMEGYINESTMVITGIHPDDDERFGIFSITTEKTRKVFLAVFINGKENLSTEVIGAMNHLPEFDISMF